MLKEHLEEYENFSLADRFMYEMSHIPRYENRLQAMFFTKTFQERISEVCVVVVLAR